ncbi:MAG: hypothetical protein NTX36_12470 [Proteobacteria bacterium]|nr:hypothetical protein [Pseudomonadota bacterium]
MTGHGGKRAGAGRKKKDRSEQGYFDDAESYLMAVVQGRTIPDAVRVQAAKTLIGYQQAKQRAPVKSPAPSQLHRKALSSVQKAASDEFEKKAIQIRAKLKAKGGK